MANNIAYKPQYKCSICGKIYDSTVDRANCELKCYAKQQEEEKKAADEKKKAEQSARKEEINKAIDNLNTLIEAYMKDYNEFDYKSSYQFGKDNLLWPTKLFEYFL